jgi:2',3'-cyclic-nucleotide 2'-phosphodiesterase (5'-nucleotidase family)
MLGTVKPSWLLAANFLSPSKYRNIRRYMKPYKELTRAGARIAVLGLTTSDFVYNWRADGMVVNPNRGAMDHVMELNARNDFVIALTHIGVDSDVKLAKSFEEIDLVVGGHSHTTLPEPVYQKNPRGRMTPIVQTGQHGEFVGNLLVDVTRGKPLKIIRYTLEPVHSQGPVDAGMQQLAREAREHLEHDYGRDWLYTVVGRSEVPLERQHESGVPTPWSKLVTDALMAQSGSDISLDVPPFSGLNQPAGPITREQLYVLYPRMFDFDDRFGWTIWTSKIRGWILKLALVEALKRNVVFGVSGATYDIVRENGKRKVKNVKIGGRSVRVLGNYKLAVPEGIGRGAIEISVLLKLLFKQSTDTRVPIWFALEDQIQSMGGVVRPLNISSSSSRLR